MSLKEVGIDDTYFEDMAEKIGELKDAYKPLGKDDILNIYNMCL